MTTKQSIKKPTPRIRIIFCILILLVGIIGFIGLKSLKKPPKEAQTGEPALPVRTITVQPEDITVNISGLGEIRSRTNLVLSSEVAGRIIHVHPHLHVGETIAQGETLLAIDARDYQNNLANARQRLDILQKDRQLAAKEFKRVSELYQKNKVGSQATVDQSERTLYSLANQISQVEHSLEQAKLQVERCTIKAPFTGRITEKNVADNEYVTPGKHLLTLIDDSDLEIQVALDSREATRWLNFTANNSTASPANWFAPLAKEKIQVRWSENEKIHAQGRLDRIVTYDQKTRTVVLAILLEKQPANTIPLVAGMFCRVDIPGRTLSNVITLPRHAVSFDNTIFLVNDNRLQRRPVKVLRREQDRALIGGGLARGEIVITTRLENPIENSLLTIISQQ